MTLPQQIEIVLMIGIGATIIFDAWLFLLARLGVPTLSFALIGRWVGHGFRGKFVHAAIGRSEPIPGELALGWSSHYVIGIAYAAWLVAWQGSAWSRQPTLAPALAIGLGTVLVPLFLMQPAMGAGFASSRTPTPFRNVGRSVVNHAVFGLGLYLSSLVAAQLPS